METLTAGADRSSLEFNRAAHCRGFAFTLLLITLFGLSVRLYRLDFESLWMDEITTVETYFHPPAALVEKAADVGQPPLDNFIGAAIARLGLADSDWWLRFPAAMFGGGAVALLGLLVKRLSGVSAGLIAAALLAVCPLHHYLSQEARPYSIFFFLGLLTSITYLRAREQSTRGSWAVYGFALFLTLMTRWTDPHFLALGLLLFGTARRLASPNCVEERAKFRGLCSNTAAAYLAYAPFFWIVFAHSTRAVAERGDHVASRVWAHLCQWYSANFHGYSTKTVFVSLPGPTWVLLAGGILASIGFAVIVTRLVKDRSVESAFILVALAPFAVTHALVFAYFGNALPKPQYLLFGTAALFALTAIGIHSAGEPFRRFGVRLATLAKVSLLLILTIPMLRAAVENLERRDKCDWRGLMTYIREHAGPEDVFAVMASDRIPPTFHVAAYGRSRYGPEGAKFIPLGFHTEPHVFFDDSWRRKDNTLWIVAYKNRMYLGYDQVPTPQTKGALVRAHDFDGLFLIEASGGGDGRIRLLRGLKSVYEGLEPGRGLIAPALLAAAVETILMLESPSSWKISSFSEHNAWMDRGGSVTEVLPELEGVTARWQEIAKSQCANDDERALLWQWIRVVMAGLNPPLGVEHHASAEEGGGAAEPLPGG